MNKIKVTIIIVVFLIILLFINKLFLCSKYSSEKINNIENIGNTEVKHKSAKDYLKYNGIKIRNDFKKYVYEEDDNSYVLYNKDEDVINIFAVFEVDTFMNIFLEYDNSILSKKTLTKFLEENNIDNDISLIKFLINYEKDVNILTPSRDIKLVYYIDSYLKDVMPLVTEYSVINGDYNGLILYNQNHEEEMNIDVVLLQDNRRFILSFIGIELDEKNIIDLVGTVIIDEEE